MSSVLIIATMSVVTILLRVLPFIIFDRADREVPGWIRFLGKYLPPALMSMLIIYCLRGLSFTASPYGIPELLCIALAAGLHIWKGNVLLSIGVSTVLYMVLVQAVFA